MQLGSGSKKNDQKIPKLLVFTCLRWVRNILHNFEVSILKLCISKINNGLQPEQSTAGCEAASYQVFGEGECQSSGSQSDPWKKNGIIQHYSKEQGER